VKPFLNISSISQCDHRMCFSLVSLVLNMCLLLVIRALEILTEDALDDVFVISTHSDNCDIASHLGTKMNVHSLKK
jgi:hypothetical protein